MRGSLDEIFSPRVSHQAFLRKSRLFRRSQAPSRATRLQQCQVDSPRRSPALSRATRRARSPADSPHQSRVHIRATRLAQSPRRSQVLSRATRLARSPAGSLRLNQVGCPQAFRVHVPAISLLQVRLASRVTHRQNILGEFATSDLAFVKQNRTLLRHLKSVSHWPTSLPSMNPSTSMQPSISTEPSSQVSLRGLKHLFAPNARFTQVLL